MERPRNLNEVMTGTFMVLVALTSFYLTWSLSSRTDIGLGPGYVPKMLAGALLLMGVGMIVHGLRWGEPEGVDPWHLRPLVLVLGSVAFFAATIERLGLVVAVTGLVLLSCAANREARVHETILLAVGSVLASLLLFVKALGLQIPVLPPMLR